MRISDWSSDVCSSDLQHEDAVDFGHRMLDRALDAQGSSLDGIPSAVLDRFLEVSKLKRLEELLSDIALGNRMPDVVASQLLASRDRKRVVEGKSVSVRVDPGGTRSIKKKTETQ